MDGYDAGRALPPSGDPGHSPDPRHPAYLRTYGTEDAARMGLDRNTPEGAQIHFFSHLDAGKPWHKVVAWVALLVMFGMPVLFQLLEWTRR